MSELLHPARHLDLEGGCNIRDLGGYTTEDGNQTRWGIFFRSGEMHRISARSRDELVAHGIRTVVDLRTGLETLAEPNVFAGSDEVRYIHVNIIGDEPLELDSVTQKMGSTSDVVLASYSTILDQRRDSVREVLAALVSADGHPALFHCSAGKDRTGIIAAILLGLVGVPSEVIAEDYALSARYLLSRYQEDILEEEESHICTWEDIQREWCPPKRMLEVLSYLDREYGGVEGYVRATGLRNDQLASLRSALVE